MNTIFRSKKVFFPILAFISLYFTILLPTTSVAMQLLQTIKDSDGTIEELQQLPYSIAISPDNHHVYVASSGYDLNDDTLMVFSRNQNTGELTLVKAYRNGLEGVEGLEGVKSIAISPDNQYVYVATKSSSNSEDSIVIFKRDIGTGQLSFIEIQSLSISPAVMIASPNDQLYLADRFSHTIVIFNRNVTTGHLTLVDQLTSDHNGIDGEKSLVMSADGKHIYLTSRNENAVIVFERNLNTDILTLVEKQTDGENGVDGLAGAKSLAMSPDDQYLYVVSEEDDAIAIFSRDANNQGKLTYENHISSNNVGLDEMELVITAHDSQHIYVIGSYDAGWLLPDIKGVIITFSNDNGSLSKKNSFEYTSDLSFAKTVTITPNDQHLYVLTDVNDGDLIVDKDAILTFSNNSATGELSLVENIQNGTQIVTGLEASSGNDLETAFSIAISPDEQHLYVINEIANAITVFRRDMINQGQLAFIEKNEVNGAKSLAVSQDGNHVYVTSKSENALVVFRRDQETGTLLLVDTKTEGRDGVSGLIEASSVVVDGNSVYVGGSNKAIAIFTRNPNNDTLTFNTVKDDWGDGNGAISMDISPDKKYLYMLGNSALTVFERETNSGNLIFIESHDQINGNGLVAISPDSQNMYITDYFTDSLFVFERLDTGELKFIQKLKDGQLLKDGQKDIDGLDYVTSAKVSADGNHVYVVTGNSIGFGDNALAVFSRNPDTGELTLLPGDDENEEYDNINNDLGFVQSLVITADNQNVYVARKSDNAISVFKTIQNQSPVNTVPTTVQTIDEDTQLTFSATNTISIDDKDAFTHSVEVTLTTTNGTLTLNGTNGLTFLNGSSNGTAEMSFTGTIDDLNTALDGMTFMPSKGLSDKIASITIITDDKGNTGGGGPQKDEDIINITVNAIIGAPSVTPAATTEKTQTTNGLVISRNEGDGVEISHFKITNITGGTLYQNDGTTPINDGEFIDFAFANLGLRFTPSSTTNGSFDVQSATCNTDKSCLDEKSGSTTATISVNTPPMLAPIGHQAVNVGETLKFTASATDNQNALNQNTLRFNLNGAPDNATINSNTGEFTWRPTHSGDYQMTVIVTETNGNPSNLRDSESITITVSTAPQFESISDHYQLVFGKSLDFQAIASHPERHALRYSLTEAPPTAKINASNGEFTWEPSNAGTYEAIVRVTETVDNQYIEETVTIAVEKAQTRLRFWLDQSAIFKDSGIVNLSGQLTSYPDVKERLADLDIHLTIKTPDGSFFLADTTQTQEDGTFTFNQLGNFEQEGPYTFRVSFTGTKNLESARTQEDYLQVRALAGHALLIQGRLLDDPDGLKTHNKSLNRVYRRLKARGFDDENIEYLNYNTDQSAFEIDVDAEPSHANIEAAFQRIQQRMNADPGPLYIIMVDHGGVEGHFYLDEGEQEYISPKDLDGWLDKLEAGLTPLAKQQERVSIIGACYSGSYIPTLSAKGRVIVTSTTETEESYKGPTEPDKVRSGEFFIEALFAEFGKGKSLKTAFEIATQHTEMLTRIGGNAPVHPDFEDASAQHPLLDDDANQKGSNVFWSDSREGAKAKHIYLGIGPKFNLNPFNFDPYHPNNPLMILAVTPTQYLSATQSGYPLFAEVNHAHKVAGNQIVVTIRAPSVTLSTDGTEQTGQLEIDGLQRITLTADSRRKFTGYFNGFTEPGQYEILYFANDSETGEMALQRSIVYKKPRFENQPPQPFNLLYPEHESETKTNVIFDWSNAIDPDGDLVTYTFSIAMDSQFQHKVYQQEGLTMSMTYVDENTVIDEGTAATRLGLRDDEKYFWRVQAIDHFGNRINSTPIVFSFKTNNKNVPPRPEFATVVTDYDAPIQATDIQTVPNEPNTVFKDCQGIICRILLKTLNRMELTIPGFQATTILPNHSPETSHSHLRRKNPTTTQNSGQIQFAVDSINVEENRGKIDFLVERFSGSHGEISVQYATSDGNAIADNDYTPVTGELTWADKETLSKRISLEIQDDSSFEGDETLVLKLLDKSGESLLGNPNQILITIADNEEESDILEPINQENPDDSQSDNSDENQATESSDNSDENQATEGSGENQADEKSVESEEASEGSNENQTNDGSGENEANDSTDESNQTEGSQNKTETDENSLQATPDDETEILDEIATPTTADAPVLTFSDDEHQKTQHTPSPRKEGNQTVASPLLRGDLGVCSDDKHKKTQHTPNPRKEGNKTAESPLEDLGECSEVVSPLLRGDLGVCSDDEHQKTQHTPNPSQEGNQTTTPVLKGDLGMCSEVVSPLLRGDLGVCDFSSLQFSERTYQATENQGLVEIAVIRANSTAGEVSVKYQAIDATAKTGEDYQLKPGTLTWADGEEGEKSFEITLINNNQAESPETLILVLSEVTGHVKLDEISRHAILTINDDETTVKPCACPKPEIPSCDKEVAEESLDSPENTSVDEEILASPQNSSFDKEENSDSSDKREPEDISCPPPPEIDEPKFPDEIIKKAGCDSVAESELVDCVLDKVTQYLFSPPKPCECENVTSDLLPDLGDDKAIDRFGKIMENPSHAKFSGGISINMGDYQIQEKLELSDWLNITGKLIKITGKITVDPIHIGKTSDILVVAAHIPSFETEVSSYYMQNADKSWFLWGGNMKNLLPFQSVDRLNKIHFVNLFTSDSLPDMAGKFRLYFGYRLENGTIIFNGEQQIEVEIK
jgi:6-phosphogluconolactonase (cycloisomerase 2 family)